MNYYDNTLNPITMVPYSNILYDLPLYENSFSYRLVSEYLKINRDLKICIITSQDLHDNNCNIIDINKSMDMIYIVVADHEYHGAYHNDTITIPCYTLTSEYPIINTNCIYFPIWLFASRLFAQSDNLHYNEKCYKVSCLNRNPRLERIYNFINLQTLPFVNDIKLSFFSELPNVGGKINNDLLTSFSSEETNIFASLLDNIPASLDLPDNEIIMSITDDGYSNSMLNIITETYHSINFLSEKTFKPIRAEQLFLMCGPYRAVAQLRDLGFDTFDDYIDHDYYDLEIDWKLRILKMQEVLGQIYNNIDVIYNETCSRRQANNIYFKSDEIISHISNMNNKLLNTIVRS